MIGSSLGWVRPLQSRAAARAMAAVPGRPWGAATTRRAIMRTRMRMEKSKDIVYMYLVTRTECHWSCQNLALV
eukprot:1858063-Pyramimonas_sp.AAC.1